MTLPRGFALCLLVLAGCTEGQKPTPLSRDSGKTTQAERPVDLNLHPISDPQRGDTGTAKKD